ncbi:MAG: rod-binding protein [Planctomycetes bacterium]|nr:rod-binding protein [Planctomycetota bacterium]
MQDIGKLQTAHVLDLFSPQKLRVAEALSHDGAETAAKRFESLLATQLVKEMRRSLDEGFFGSGPGSEVFDGWLDEHLGEALAKGRGLGLRDAIAHNLGEIAANEEKKP